MKSKVKGISKFEAIQEIENAVIRDKVAVGFFYLQYEFLEDAETLLEKQLGKTADKFSFQALSSLRDVKKEGSALYEFEFADSSGEIFDQDGLQGKVTLLDFYITGCKACQGFYKKVISRLEDQYAHREDFQIITISADNSEELWQKGVKSGLYNSPETINLYAMGKAHRHPFFRRYNIYGFPSKLILDRQGNIYKASGLPQSFQELNEIIEEALQKD